MIKLIIKFKLFFYTIIVFTVFNFIGCIATTSYFTGKTLEKGKIALSPGLDNLVIKSTDKNIEIEKPVFTPSFGAAIGLPARFECGIRWFYVQTFEGILRWEATPNSFNNILDLSLNFIYGYYIEEYSYLKYGLTVSKDIYGFEPFIHYYQYHFLESKDRIYKELFSEVIDINRNIGFGIAVPFSHAKLYPEMNYQFFNNDFSNGLYYFNLGIRANLN